MNYPRINMRATGANIKRLRKEKGITVQQIADFMGFTEPVAVYKWQRGDSLPTTNNLLALSKLMNCSMEDILVEDDEMSSFIYCCRMNYRTRIFVIKHCGICTLFSALVQIIWQLQMRKALLHLQKKEKQWLKLLPLLQYQLSSLQLPTTMQTISLITNCR